MHVTFSNFASRVLVLKPASSLPISISNQQLLNQRSTQLPCRNRRRRPTPPKRGMTSLRIYHSVPKTRQPVKQPQPQPRTRQEKSLGPFSSRHDQSRTSCFPPDSRLRSKNEQKRRQKEQEREEKRRAKAATAAPKPEKKENDQLELTPNVGPHSFHL